jgi:16S rRNA (guanine(966)-N(2))-methyltransferase RsmD
MPDRVREAIFNMLGSYYAEPGALPPIHVADVFAGSGSMGLEALSRGAASCAFFENDPVALSALKRNLDALEAGAAAAIVRGSAWSAALPGCSGRSFDLIFLDPPYRDSADASAEGAVKRYLTRLAESSDRDTLVVLHHNSKVRYTMDCIVRWKQMHERAFGSSTITFFALSRGPQ